MMRVSIIINNYNYGRYLRQCIDSVLNQTVPASEVIVVDDGSTDESREILRSYDGPVQVILKENGGQASALNAGFAASSGDWILFLDADDYLLPDAVGLLRDGIDRRYTRVQFFLRIIDCRGRYLNTVPRNSPPPAEEFPFEVLSSGRLPSYPPTSGNLLSREFVKALMPIPEDRYKLCADLFLIYANLRGQRVKHVPSILGCYRSHGSNAYFRNSHFVSPSAVVAQRVTAIDRLLHLLFSQEVDPRLPRAQDYARKYLVLNQAYDLILAHRFLKKDQASIPINLIEAIDVARDHIREIENPSGRFWERCNLFVLRFAPSGLMHVLGKLEEFWKRRRQISQDCRHELCN